MGKEFQCFILAMLLGFAVDSKAQVTVKLDSGATVRILAPSFSGKLITGDLTRLDASTITIRGKNSSETERISLPGIERLEVDRGTRVGKGALIGLLAGVGLGVVLTRAAGRSGDENDYWPELYVPPATVAGILVGAIAGSSHKWEEVPLHDE